MDKFGRYSSDGGAVTLIENHIRDICREVKFDTLENINQLQLHVTSLQTHALSLDERLAAVLVRQEEIIRRLASQLFHFVLKVHATLPATGLRENILKETDKTYIDWGDVLK